MNQGGTVSGGGNFDLHQHGANYGPRDVGSHAPPLPIGIAITTPAEPSGTTCLSELDPTTVGMEFVLEYASWSHTHTLGFEEEADQMVVKAGKTLSRPYARQSEEARRATRPLLDYHIPPAVLSVAPSYRSKASRASVVP